MNPLLIGLSAGIIGSLHCLGMCGPLAMALPTHHLSKLKRYLAITNYNLGRVLTYIALGVLLGLVSKSLFFHLSKTVSILSGIAMLFLYFVYKNKLPLDKFWITRKVQQQVGKLYSSKLNPLQFGVLGLLNGLLPCGLVYSVLLVAFAGSSTQFALLTMLGFGLGTIPAMASLSLFQYAMPINIRLKLARLTPVFVIVVSSLLILRGLNLGIAYLSPKLTEEKVSCCHK